MLNSPDAANAFSFGFSTAISGSTVLIGSDGAGPVYVFTKTATGWKNEADLTGSDTVTGDDFGSTVALSGAVAVVGAPESAANAGRAYFFKRTANGWRQVAEAKGTVRSGLSWAFPQQYRVTRPSWVQPRRQETPPST